jgi:hypothetical protein
MNKITKLILSIFAALISCSGNEPNLSTTPFIEFLDFKYIDSQIPTHPAALNVSFYITDGDFDLGVDPPFVEPYNYSWYFLKKNKSKISDQRLQSGEFELSELISFKDTRTLEYDTFPPFEPPFDCNNWNVFRINNKVIDTIYFQHNTNRYNIFIDFYHSSNSQDWTLIDWNISKYPACSKNYNEIFPDLNVENTPIGHPFQIEHVSKSKVKLIYSITGGVNTLSILFKDQKIKLKIKIQDRAYHKSNEIETSEIQF